jgi:tetratricopeptide (TPR) repeat protein
LVYNIGERVEGYTNFFWIILLIPLKLIFGVDYIVATRLFSIIGGLSIIWLLLLFSRRHDENNHSLIYGAAIILLLFNQSFPYWTMAGLETTAFTFMILLALYLEYQLSQMTAPILAIASLLRPEGLIVFLIILSHKIIVTKRLPIYFLFVYILPLIPYAAFKLIYYGSFFPNTYYAKSGLSPYYIMSGLEYFRLFVTSSGAYGLFLILPLIAIKRLWKRYSLLYLFISIYSVYIIAIGGDTLKVYRFFQPILPVLYFLVALSIVELQRLLKFQHPKSRQILFSVTLSAATFLGVFACLLSKNHIETYRKLENGLVEKMQFIGGMLKKHFKSDFTVAASAIGYELKGHRIIDMLGLTDKYIALNPEIIEGIKSTWKESRFNSRYLLQQQPDFIVFSTNDKPSAPAELSLFLHSEFRKNYSITGFLKDASKDRWAFIYMKCGDIIISRDSMFGDVGFINELKTGYDYRFERRFVDAANAFKEANLILSEEYDLLSSNIGECLYRQNLVDSPLPYFRRAIQLNQYNWRARNFLAKIALIKNRAALAQKQTATIMAMTPWVYDSSQALTEGAVASGDSEESQFIGKGSNVNSPMTAPIGAPIPAIDVQDSVEVLNRAATRLCGQGEITEALYYFDLSLKLDSANLSTYKRLGEALLYAGKTTELLNLALLLERKFPQHPRGLMDAGQLFCQLGDLDKGGELLSRAYDLDSSDVFIMVNFGVFQLRRGNLPTALALLKKAVTSHPDYFAANYNLSLVYLSLNDRQNASFYLKRAAEFAETKSDSAQVASMLKKLR